MRIRTFRCRCGGFCLKGNRGIADSGDLEAIAKLPLPDLEKIAVATLTGMTSEQFQAEAKKWLASAKDPSGGGWTLGQ
jgi:hypothetical protein